jgi:uncharacterized protein
MIRLPASDLERLTGWFAPFGRVLVAYSGGVDSALVAWAARRALGADGVLAVTADSGSLPRRELAAAEGLARRHDIPMRTVSTGEARVEGYAANAPDRCYFCKFELYSVLRDTFCDGGFEVTLNGTNADDPGEWRPGLEAADELNVRSPLLETGLGKDQVRALARHAGLEVWDKPAQPCLASRIPYGTRVTPERLAQVEAAEDVLAGEGFRTFRVRLAEAGARIEVGADEQDRLRDGGLRHRVMEGVRAAGFEEVTVDAEPYRRGRLNEALQTAGGGSGE